MGSGGAFPECINRPSRAAAWLLPDAAADHIDQLHHNALLEELRVVADIARTEAALMTTAVAAAVAAHASAPEWEDCFAKIISGRGTSADMQRVIGGSAVCSTASAPPMPTPEDEYFGWGGGDPRLM